MLPAPFVAGTETHPLNKIKNENSKILHGLHGRRAARIVQRQRRGLFGRFRADQGPGHPATGTDRHGRRHAGRPGRDLHDRRGVDLDDRRKDPRRSPRLDRNLARPRRRGRQLHAENHPRIQHVGSVAFGNDRHHVRHVEDRDHRHAGGLGRPHRTDAGQPDNAHRELLADNPEQRRFGAGAMDFDQPLRIRRCRTPHELRMGRHPGEHGRCHG